MELVTWGIGALYFLLLLALSTVLLIRGVTHLFVGLFACGAMLHVFQMFGFFYLRQAPGGYGANAQYFGILSAVGAFGTLLFAAAFVSLTLFLLRNKTP
jgi:hypothetical protein